MKAPNKVANVRDEFKPFGLIPTPNHPRKRVGKTKKDHAKKG